MPSLEIAVAQPAFQNHLGTLRAQTPLHGKVISSPFTFGNHKKLSSAWKSSDIPRKLNFNLGHIKIPKGGLLIKAVATLESKSLVQNENAHMDYQTSQLGMDSSSWTVKPKTSREDSEELDEREKLRRMRISKANKGNTPWNKGRKHSPETLQLIKERTRLAMQDPKVKMKLVNLGHAQSQETRTKIGLGVRMGWQRRREMLSVQENCCFEWQNLIAEASRRGYDGEEELQWDSYKIIDEQLKEEWLESVEQRKIMRRPKGSKRAPKSPEQRRKISEAISAKWNDPGYRERVCSALAKYYDASYGTERKPRRRSSGSTQSTRKGPAKKKVTEENNFSKIEIKVRSQRLRMRRSKAPSYKDPLANSKMEMIKNIRAQRAAAEAKKTKAIERARLLIAEAEKAAMALEVAATKSPIARASLIETRQLIAEAIKSIESIETGQVSAHENEDPLAASNEVISQGEKETCAGIEGLTEADNGKVNGTQTLSSSEDHDFGFDKVTLLDMLNGEEDLPPMSPSGHGLPPFSLENLIKQSDSRDQADQLEPNGNSECTKNLSTVPAEEETSDLLEPNGTKVQSQQEEMPDQYEPNGTKVQSLQEETPDQLEPNGTEVQSQQEEIPSELVTVTKKWVRGRLIEIAEEA